MPRANAMVPPDAIRIEDEVWQEAFTRREPARARRDRGLRAIDVEQADWLPEAAGRTVAESTSWSAPRPAPDPLAAAPIAAPRHSQTGAAVSARTEDAPARRTIKIQGRGAERNLPLPDSSRRRPPRRGYERTGFRPDRLAMWAVVLGFMLVLVAIISAHG
jgi:hypothetical protein